MKKFTVGQKLSARSIGDYNCVFTGTVLKRTATTITVDTCIEGVKRCKIHQSYDGSGEFVFPFGRYSMAPIFKA